MKKILCVVQKDQISKAKIKVLEQGLKDRYRDHHDPKEKVMVYWMLVPKGYAYSERKPSNAIIVMIEVEDGVPSEQREKLMGIFSNFILDQLNMSPYDLVLTVPDQAFVDQYFMAQRDRSSRQARKWVGLKIFVTAFYSKFKDGFLRIPVRL
ncbi:MAG: hypothetical protein AAF598_04600 [Bacteroidota bacterium]